MTHLLLKADRIKVELTSSVSRNNDIILTIYVLAMAPLQFWELLCA